MRKSNYADLVNLTGRNDVGLDRQVIIGVRSRREGVYLCFDEATESVRVHTNFGDQFGSLESALAAQLIARKRDGAKFYAVIKGISGKSGARGVRLLIVEAGGHASDRQLQRYVAELPESEWG